MEEVRRKDGDHEREAELDAVQLGDVEQRCVLLPHRIERCGPAPEVSEYGDEDRDE